MHSWLLLGYTHCTSHCFELTAPSSRRTRGRCSTLMILEPGLEERWALDCISSSCSFLSADCLWNAAHKQMTASKLNHTAMTLIMLLLSRVSIESLTSWVGKNSVQPCSISNVVCRKSFISSMIVLYACEGYSGKSSHRQTYASSLFAFTWKQYPVGRHKFKCVQHGYHYSK